MTECSKSAAVSSLICDTAMLLIATPIRVFEKCQKMYHQRQNIKELSLRIDWNELVRSTSVKIIMVATKLFDLYIVIWKC